MTLNLHATKVTFFYFLASLAVLAPLLLPGYTMALDMPWGPVLVPANFGSQLWLITYNLSLFTVIASSVIIQKMMFTIIFFLSGLGAHRLALLSPRLSIYAAPAYLAGVLYIFNPFIYSRLMAGQWLVLLGYALLPWAAAALWRFMTAPAWNTAWRAAAWCAAVALVSIHAIGFVALVAVVFFAIQGRENLISRTKWSLVAAGLWLAANALWLIPLLTGNSKTAVDIGGFGEGSLQAFATIPSPAGVPLSTLLLSGFWADAQDRYILLPDAGGFLWWLFAALIAIVILIGIVTAVRSRDKLGYSLLIIGFISWWLAMGIAPGGVSGSEWTTRWLIEHLPFYGGYREPQKWLMLLALAYAYFAAVGASWLVGRLKPTQISWRPRLIGALAILPILWTPLLLWGAAGQLQSSQYPDDWYTVRDILDAKAGDSPVVVLPWHMYMHFDFVGRVVANPSRHFFSSSMITGDNPELVGLVPESATPIHALINNTIIIDPETRTNAGTLLAAKKVRYIVLYKDGDWKDYGWLNKQTRVRKVFDGPTIRLYEISAPTKLQ